MEGYLQKWRNYILGWKKRYFVIKGNILYYYKHKGEKVKGKIHLAITVFNVKGSSQIILNTGINKLTLKADSSIERDNWFNAMRVAKFEGQSKENEREINGLKNDFSNSNSNSNSHSYSNVIVSKISELKLNFENFQKNYTDHFETFAKLLSLNAQSLNSTKDIFSQIYNQNKTELQTLVTQIDNILDTLKYFENPENKLKANNSNNKRKLSDNNIAIVNKNQILGEIDEFSPEFHSKSPKIFSIANPKDPIDIKEKKQAHETSNFNLNYNEYENESQIFYEAMETINNTKRYPTLSNRFILELKRNIDVETTGINSETQVNSDTQVGLFYDKIFSEVRNSLPVEKKAVKVNIWSILKDSIGKELSKISVPVYFNEPLSMLQRLCENFQYADLLSKAAKDIRSYMRLAQVAAFCIGGFSYSQNRTLKFFNPLLGETYELMDNKLKVRFFSEQVSHHPPISACYAEGEGYIFYTNTLANSKFIILKRVLEISPLGRVFINFLNFNETVSYTKPKVFVKNLISGKMYLECSGQFTVNNHTNGDFCEIEIQEDGKFQGFVKNVFGNVLAKIEGSIYSHLNVITNDLKTETVWKSDICEDESRYYFTDFTMGLNHVNEKMKEALPPTDSRFRPDLRALENQNYDLASKEKERLEDKQRKNTKFSQKNNTHKPMYFKETYDDETGELIYLYNKDYWKDRLAKNFNHFPNIFS